PSTGTSTGSTDNGNDFTKADMGLAFNLDKNYYISPRGRFFINSFFDTRLTAIPVASTPPATGSTTTATGSTATTPAGTTPDPTQTFLSSKKAGIAQVGIYAPIAVSRWTFDGSPNRLFIAPLIKGGIQTVTSGNTTSEGKRLGEDDVYNF